MRNLGQSCQDSARCYAQTRPGMNASKKLPTSHHTPHSLAFPRRFILLLEVLVFGIFGCESSPISRNVRSSVSQSVSQSSNAQKRPSKAQ